MTISIGVNLSGAEAEISHGDNNFIYGQTYIYPTAQELDYYQSKGIDLIRLPISWEAMQPVLGGNLNTDELARLETFLGAAAARGMQVIVDLHNFGRYFNNVIASAAVPTAAFEDFWTKLATALKGNPAVGGYDIMNEPHDMGGSTVWPTAAQGAVNAIRSVDMHTTIYVEGDQWTSLPFTVNDPANNVVYEAHIYFDHNGSGAYTGTYDQKQAYPTIGVDRLQAFVQWLHDNNAKGFIGEFSVPDNDPRWLVVLDNFVKAMQADGISGTYWCGGPWSKWLSFSLESPDGADKPQMSVLTKYTLDSTPPPAPVIIADSLVGKNQVLLTGAADPFVKITVFDGTKQLGTTVANGTGGWTFTTGPLAKGAHLFSATETDSAGVTSAGSKAIDPVIGSVAPVITAFSPHASGANAGFANAHSLTLTGTAPAGSTVSVSDGTNVVGTAKANSAGTWTLTTGSLTDGIHKFTAVDTDRSGNQSFASATFSVTVDTHVPAAPVITGEAVVGSNVVRLSGTAETQSIVKVFDGSQLLGTTSVDANGGWSYVTKTLANGTHTFFATATDLAGTQSPISASFDPAIGFFSGGHSETFDGAAGLWYQSLENDYDLSGHLLTQKYMAAPGQPLAAGEVDYDTAGNPIAEKFSGLTGQSFTGIEADYDPAGHLTTLKITGTTAQWLPAVALVSLVGNAPQNVGALNNLSASAMTATLNTLSHAATQKYSDPTGQSYIGVEFDFGSSGQMLDQVFNHKNGSHTVVVQAVNASLVASLVADTFVFNASAAAIGNATISNFNVAADTLALSHTIFASFAALQAAVLADPHNAGHPGSSYIPLDAHDSITLAGIAPTQLSQHDLLFI